MTTQRFRAPAPAFALVVAATLLCPAWLALAAAQVASAPVDKPAPASRPTAAAADVFARFETLRLTSKKVAGGTLAYRLLTPDGYDPKADATYPLVLFLHGAGERGTDNVAQLKWGGVQLATQLQAAAKCFVVAPQCPPGKQWVNTPWAKGSYSTAAVPAGDELTMAIEAVEAATTEFKIDRGRVYVMGLSMGGYGTWDAIARRPDLFAAAVPICGAGDPAAADKLKPLAIWVFHGGADTVVPTQGSRDMAAAMQKAGAAEPTFKYTEFPGVGHNAWTKAWETPGLWEWLVAQRRPSPAR
jgi:predicted peptidase